MCWIYPHFEFEWRGIMCVLAMVSKNFQKLLQMILHMDHQLLEQRKIKSKFSKRIKIQKIATTVTTEWKKCIYNYVLLFRFCHADLIVHVEFHKLNISI